MDLRNWEFYEDGNALAGASVKVRDAVLTHPNGGTVLATTTTGPNGEWAFTGLTDTAKDVEVIWGNVSQYHRWYKGMTRHNTGKHVFTEDVTMTGAQTVAGLLTASNGFTLAGGTLTLPAGSVETADLAANAVTQSGFAIGSSGALTTSSGSFVDMTDMSVTLNPTFGGDLLVWFHFIGYHSAASGAITTGIQLDSGSVVGSMTQQPSGVNEIPSSLITLTRFTGVSAASHTVKGKWNTATGATANVLGNQRQLLVLELKK